jgi:hypothetical protein
MPVHWLLGVVLGPIICHEPVAVENYGDHGIVGDGLAVAIQCDPGRFHRTRRQDIVVPLPAARTGNQDEAAAFRHGSSIGEQKANMIGLRHGSTSAAGAAGKTFIVRNVSQRCIVLKV